MSQGPEILFWITAALWTGATLWILRDFLAVDVLPPLAELPREAPESVTIVVTARNEEACIERTVETLLAQTAVRHEVVVVDDRSTDGTPRILARLAERFPRLRSLRVDRLPDGWLGKPHACATGAGAVSTDWILFCDADVWMRPDVVARAIAVARDQGADHVCLFPGERRSTFPARAAMLGFSLGLVHFAAEANRDRPGSAIGIGAFNLVRTSAYRGIGGHAPLRMEIVDDLKLGRLLRQAGSRSRAFGASLDMNVSWAPTFPSIFRALDKNLFASFDLSVPLSLAVIAASTLWVGAAWAGALSGTVAGAAAALGLASTAIPAALISRRTGWGVAPALLTPILGPVLVPALLRSMAITLRAGGVRWRDTFYPLAELRAGLVPKWRRAPGRTARRPLQSDE